MIVQQVHVLPKHKKILDRIAKNDPEPWTREGELRSMSKHARRAIELYAEHIKNQGQHTEPK